jgi:hypothetical protein
MLGEYRDHTLDVRKRARVEAHFLTCDECTAYLRSYEQTIRLSQAAFGGTGNAAAEDLPETAIQEILRGARVRSGAPP